MPGAASRLTSRSSSCTGVPSAAWQSEEPQHRRAGRGAKTHRLGARRRAGPARQKRHGVARSGALDLGRDVPDLEHRPLGRARRDDGAGFALPLDEALAGKARERPVDGHPRHPEARHQRVLRRHPASRRPRPGEDRPRDRPPDLQMQRPVAVEREVGVGGHIAPRAAFPDASKTIRSPRAAAPPHGSGQAGGRDRGGGRSRPHARRRR